MSLKICCSLPLRSPFISMMPPASHFGCAACVRYLSASLQYIVCGNRRVRKPTAAIDSSTRGGGCVVHKGRAPHEIFALSYSTSSHNFAPHSRQNFSLASTSLPQLGHFLALAPMFERWTTESLTSVPILSPM